MGDTGAVADHLGLDMSRMPDELLDIEIARAERARRFGSTAGEGVLQSIRGQYGAQVTTAAWTITAASAPSPP